MNKRDNTSERTTYKDQLLGAVQVDIVAPVKWKKPYFTDPRAAQVCISAWSEVAASLDFEVVEASCGSNYIHIILSVPATAGCTIANYLTKARKASKAALRDEFGEGMLSSSAGALWSKTALVRSIGAPIGDADIDAYLQKVRTQRDIQPYG